MVALSGKKDKMNPFVSIFQPSRRRGSRPPTVTLPAATNDSLSSSSDGSVPTPEDDPDLSARSSTRFANWLRSSSSSSSSKSSSSSSRPKPPPLTATALSPPLPPPPQASSTPSDSDDDDEDSDNYGDDDIKQEETTPPPPLPRPPPIPASSSVRASSRSPGRSGRPPRTLSHPSHQNLRDITLSAINQRPPCPPFLHAPSGPVFPRSSNSSRLLPVVQTTRIVHHKTTIIRRLEAKSLTPIEHQSIAPFYNRSKDSHGVLSTRRRLDLEDVSDLKDAKRVQDFSFGLHRWISRPCFEERCVAWHWDSDGKEIVRKQIQGSGKAVALLEYSEGLEAMAGFGLFPTEYSRRLSAVPPVPRLDIQLTGSSSPSPGPPTPKSAPPSTSARKPMRMSPVILPPQDDEGDDVPLGIHITKREEQGREEMKKRALADEVIKARMRADAVRTGAADRENLHDRRQTYSRPTYDAHASFSKSEPAKQDPHTLDSTRRPPSVRSATSWNSDASRQWSSSSYLSPFTPSTYADSEGTKSQRRVSMLGSASDVGMPNATSSQSRSSRMFTSSPPPQQPTPVSPFPMMHTMPVYPLQLPPVMPVFMQPGYIAPPSPPSFNYYPLPSPPPIRAAIPVSRSAERLGPAPGSAYSNGRPSISARRATAGPEDMQQMVEQMKRSGLHKELPGRSPLSRTTDQGSRPGGHGQGQGQGQGQGREDRNQVQHHKHASDPRSQSGRTDQSKRFSRMPSALSLPSKKPSTALYVSR